MDRSKTNTESRILRNRNDVKMLMCFAMIFLFLVSFDGVHSNPVVVVGGPDTADRTISVGEVEITHVRNAGFLFVSGDTKVLVDALYRGEGDNAVPAHILGSMQQGLPPFDGVNLALATHAHEDHFDGYSVGKYLENNPDAIFISDGEAENRLQMEFPRFEDVKDRFKALTVEKGEKVQLTVNGIELEVLGMRHGLDFSGRNYGYLLNIGGLKILHMGDSLLTYSEVEVFELPQEEVDMVFVPWWYILQDKYARTVREGIQAKQVVVMHNETRTTREKIYEWEWILERVETEFPDAIAFYELQEKPVEGVVAKEEEPSEEESEEETTCACLGTLFLWGMLAAGAAVVHRRQE